MDIDTKILITLLLSAVGAYLIGYAISVIKKNKEGDEQK